MALAFTIIRDAEMKVEAIYFVKDISKLCKIHMYGKPFDILRSLKMVMLINLPRQCCLIFISIKM